MSNNIHFHAPQLPKNRRFYALIGGNLVVLALVGFFAVRPVFGMLTTHTTEITKLKAEITSAQTRTNELRKLKESYPTYEQTYDPIIKNLPRTKDVAGYQTQLDELAKATSNQLTTLDTSGSSASKPGGAPQAGGAAQVGGFPTTPVKVDLTGTYATVLDFIQRVEKMNRFTRVTSMDIKGAGNTGELQATLELQTLYIPS